MLNSHSRFRFCLHNTHLNCADLNSVTFSPHFRGFKLVIIKLISVHFIVFRFANVDQLLHILINVRVHVFSLAHGLRFFWMNHL